MPPVTQERLAEDAKDLSSAINGLRADFAEFKGEVKRDLRWILAIGACLVGFLAWAVKEGFDLSRQAGVLTAHVAANAAEVNRRFDEAKADVNRRFDEAKDRSVQLETRMDKLEAKVDAKLDRVLERLEQALKAK